MELDNLVGLKNINPQGSEKWAYEQHGKDEHFQLQWRNADNRDWDDAADLKGGDMLLLIQRGLITHIVEVVGSSATVEGRGQWNLSRTDACQVKKRSRKSRELESLLVKGSREKKPALP